MKKHADGINEVRNNSKASIREGFSKIVEGIADWWNTAWLFKAISKSFVAIYSIVLSVIQISHGYSIVFSVLGIIAAAVITISELASSKKDANDIAKIFNIENKQLLAAKEEICEKDNTITDLTNACIRYNSSAVILKSVKSARRKIDEICYRKLTENLDRFITIDGTIRSFIADTRNPTSRLGDIFDSIALCLSEISPLDHNDIYISAAISLDNNHWDEFTIEAVDMTPSVEELLQNNSLFKLVATPGHKAFEYIPDKSKPGKLPYYYDSVDETKGRRGSIICWRISLTGKHLGSMIISISTYGEPLVSLMETDEHGNKVQTSRTRLKEAYESRIRDDILKQFAGILREELLWYVIQIRGTLS